MAEKWVWLATVGGRGELRQQIRFSLFLEAHWAFAWQLGAWGGQ